MVCHDAAGQNSRLVKLSDGSASGFKIADGPASGQISWVLEMQKLARDKDDLDGAPSFLFSFLGLDLNKFARYLWCVYQRLFFSPVARILRGFGCGGWVLRPLCLLAPLPFWGGEGGSVLSNCCYSEGSRSRSGGSTFKLKSYTLNPKPQILNPTP